MLILKWTKPSHILLNECWMIFIQLWIFNVICTVCIRRWTRWFRFTTFNKSSNTISIVAVRLSFDFTNSDFIIILIGFLLFRYHIKRINWPCLFFLFCLYFFQVIFMIMSKKNDDRVQKNCDKEHTCADDRICNRVI